MVKPVGAVDLAAQLRRISEREIWPLCVDCGHEFLRLDDNDRCGDCGREILAETERLKRQERARRRQARHGSSERARHRWDWLDN